MRYKASAVLLTVLFLLLPSRPAHTFEGPLFYRNGFPLFTHLNTPSIESARPESSVFLGLSYSSVYMVKESTAWSVGLDMEEAELDLRLKKNFNDSWEAGVDIPFLSFNSGFMDGFLQDYHNAFGFPDYGRKNRPLNDFLYTVKRDGKTVVAGEGGRAAPGDITVSLKKTVITGDPAISVLASVELPTGDAKTGYGNGSVGESVVLLLDKDLGKSMRLYLNLGASFPGDLRGYERVRLRDYVFASAALEAVVTTNLNLVAQAYYEESPYPKTGIETIDRSAVILTLGGRYSRGPDSFELAFTEDPSTSGAPDFSLSLGYKRSFR